jgi:ketosteroid isomerase-like protein
LNNPEIRATLDRYWEATVALDLERVHEIYHDDVVVEFQQSGERIVGKHNIYELRHITLLNLLLKSWEVVEKEISG